jgi:hypothetical protein
MPEPASSPSDWPGKRLGLPNEGPRSIARIGRRVAALAIDWALAVIISIAFFQYDPFATLAVFAVTQIVALLLMNGSVGHLFLRMRVVPDTGGYLGVWRPFVRTILLCLVIPAVIWDADQRGLHDKAARTILVRI